MSIPPIKIQSIVQQTNCLCIVECTFGISHETPYMIHTNHVADEIIDNWIHCIDNWTQINFDLDLMTAWKTSSVKPATIQSFGRVQVRVGLQLKLKLSQIFSRNTNMMGSKNCTLATNSTCNLYHVVCICSQPKKTSVLYCVGK